ncbi:MAG: Crp/Fnr family transcriptional regulator [Bacteroidia bacterium]|nr:Crp/Fnr family transcriptional regulator [Bacteroidia bacterium]
MKSFLKAHIPFIEAELLEEWEDILKVSTFTDGQTILTEGGGVAGIPIVVSGRIKVFRRKEDKELLLYYIRSGESCAMSFQACISQKNSQVYAVSEGETEALLIPTEKLKSWMRKYPSINAYMFNIYNLRYTDLLESLDHILFGNMEGRLLHYLAKKVKGTEKPVIQLSHQEIAYEMGTAREVISRILKKLELEGKIILSRKSIELCDYNH